MVKARRSALKKYDIVPKGQSKKQFEVPGILCGEFGEDVLKEVRSEYRGYDFMQDAIYNSHPYFIVAVNKVIRPLGLRTVTPSDIEKIRADGTLPLSKHDFDTALVLRTDGNPNEYLAKDLMKQVKHRKGRRARMPVMIPFAGLELKRDSNAPNGLRFKLSEDSEIIYAPILNSVSGRLFSKIDGKKGIPSKLSKYGDKYLWTINSGLSRLCLQWGGHINSKKQALDDGNISGQIVIVSTSARAA